MPVGEIGTLIWVLIGTGVALYVTFWVRKILFDKFDKTEAAGWGPDGFEVLDMMSISPNNSIYLIRIGNEDIALSISPTGARVIATVKENEFFHTREEVQSETARYLAERFCVKAYLVCR